MLGGCRDIRFLCHHLPLSDNLFQHHKTPSTEMSLNTPLSIWHISGRQRAEKLSNVADFVAHSHIMGKMTCSARRGMSIGRSCAVYYRVITFSSLARSLIFFCMNIEESNTLLGIMHTITKELNYKHCWNLLQTQQYSLVNDCISNLLICLDPV